MPDTAASSSPRWPCEPSAAAVAALLATAAAGRGIAPLSDPLAIDVRNGAGTLLGRCDDTGLAGIAQLSLPERADAEQADAEQPDDARQPRAQLQTVTRPDATDQALVEELAAAALAHAGVEVGEPGAGTVVDWWIFADDAEATASAAAAEALGFRLDRELLIMRRPLPTPARATLSTRAFVPGVDDEAWVAVNNRAFAGHAEQGGWTTATLAQRRAELWFDAEGFRVYEDDGRMLAFCWTKVHGSGTARVGEIYVIGVDPDAQGRGLGRQLTQAGLDWMADEGITEALLYVAGDNTAAIATYERLGFTVSRRDRAYRRTPAG